MKNYFIQYKTFLLFLGKFIFVYLVLTFAYETYLNQFNSKKFEVDNFTELVSNQTVKLLKFYNSNSYQLSNLEASSIKLYYKKKYIAQIIEGCNGLSVIILFTAFVIAFTGKFKHTILFIIAGSLSIHLLNVFRISFLCILIYDFPEYEEVLHNVIFPLIIYGFVFLLWVIWVNKFSLYAKKFI